MKPGIYYDMTNEDYHAQSAISSSYLKQWIIESPMHAEYGEVNISSIVADIGTATHSEALEPEKFNVICSDEKSRATKAYKEHAELCKLEGKVLLPRKDYELVQGMVHGMETENGEIIGGLMNDSHCGKLLKQEDKICEASIFVKHHTGLLLSIRPDIYSPKLKVMGDVKTCQDASERGFGREIYKRGYHLQAAFYCLIAKLHGWDVKTWGFLAVEKKKPYLAHFHTLGPAAMNYSMRVVEATLLEIAEARISDKYSSNWGTYSEHDLPGYLADEIGD